MHREPEIELRLLREAEARMRAILDRAVDGIVTVDVAGRLESLNRSSERMFGYAAGEVLGREISCLIRFFEGAESDPNWPAHVPDAEASIQRFETTGRRKDGTEIPLEVSMSAVVVGDRRLVTLLLRDIGERKRLEDALRVAKEAAEQASRAQTDFLANVSHEIRTPLNAILGVADLLWESELDDEQRQYLSLFRRAGTNLLALVNDLLTAQLQTGTDDSSMPVRSAAPPAPCAPSPQPPAPAVRALDILLVEDHPDNRLIVQSYLKNTPHRVTIAENGEAALAIFEKGSFHIVLMDMQMPVMDGYEATRRIRAWEREQGKQPTPILAVTAHALREEVERTKHAGCDAHLGKPIVKATLLAALEEHASAASRGDEALLSTIDPDLLDLVPGYVQNRFRDIAVCRERLEQGRFEEIRVVAHGMAGSGGAYGFDEITRIGRSLQVAARGQDAPTCGRAIDELDAYVRRIHSAHGQ